MVGKLAWGLIFSAGTAAGGGAAFFLPERLWSNAYFVTIYKKGNENGDDSYLKVGGTEENQYSHFETQNTKSLLRVGEKGLEDMSGNYWNSKNNSFWMVGKKHKENSQQWDKNKLNKKEVSENDKGTLTIFLADINCENFQKNDDFKKESISLSEKIRVSCKSKGTQKEEALFAKKD